MADNQPIIEHPELPNAEPAAAAPTAAEPKLYGGKYQSIEAWEQATRHSEQEGARLANRVRELESQAETFAAQQRVNPADQRQARQDPIQALNEFGIPVEPMQELMRQTVADYFAPRLAVEKAMGEVMQRRPEFGPYRQDVDTWLASHPDVQSKYQQTVASNPNAADMALEWVFDRFTEDRRNAVATTTQKQPSAVDASIPVAQAAADRNGTNANADVDDLMRRIDYGDKYKDYHPFAQLRLKEILNRHPDLPKI